MSRNYDFGTHILTLAQAIQDAALGHAPGQEARDFIVRTLRDAAAAALEEAAGYNDAEYFDAVLAFGKYDALAALYLQLTGDALDQTDSEIQALEAEYFGFSED